MQPDRVPTRFGPATRLCRPKSQGNQGLFATPQAEMCPRTANSGQGVEIVPGHLIRHPDRTFHEKGVDVRLAEGGAEMESVDVRR